MTRVAEPIKHSIKHSISYANMRARARKVNDPKSHMQALGQIKMRPAPWKKSNDKPRQHIKKQRHYFADKGLSRKAMVFPVVMYGYKSWTIKKAEHGRTDAFE